MGGARSAEPLPARTVDPRATGALLVAARRCDSEAAVRLLACGADPGVRSEHTGRPALSFAAQCADGGLDIVRELLAARADVHAASQDKQTALHVAVAWERAPVVRLLLDAGASKNAQDVHGHTPLSLSARRNGMYL
mmetsp:Transcript_33080/g.84081  ORF Transcript_33080/g.84081 Transcript_33080/m.84081 type:complete len:137 (-) Transcript_33080:136-546(-)